MTTPSFIVISGPIGAGKTTTANALKRRINTNATWVFAECLSFAKAIRRVAQEELGVDEINKEALYVYSQKHYPCLKGKFTGREILIDIGEHFKEKHGKGFWADLLLSDVRYLTRVLKYVNFVGVVDDHRFMYEYLPNSFAVYLDDGCPMPWWKRLPVWVLEIQSPLTEKWWGPVSERFHWHLRRRADLVITAKRYSPEMMAMVIFHHFRMHVDCDSPALESGGS